MKVEKITSQYKMCHCGDAGIFFFEGNCEERYELHLSDDCQMEALDVGTPGSFEGDPVPLKDGEKIYNADSSCWHQYQWFQAGAPCEKPNLEFGEREG